MRVEQLMARPVQCCRPDDMLAHAAEFMWKHDCGSLPVVIGDGAMRVASVITDRDICMCSLFQDKRLRELQVSQAMAKQVQVCRASDSLADAETILRKALVRTLPLVDEEGTLVEIISLADLANEAAKESASHRQEITETEVADTLALSANLSAGIPLFEGDSVLMRASQPHRARAR